MKPSKVFILLSDGVGLRNFAYTDFWKQAEQNNIEIVFINNTPFDLKKMGYREIKVSQMRPHKLTDLFKKARVQVDLDLNIKRFNDQIYNAYRFPFNYNSLTESIKSFTVSALSKWYSSENGIKKLRKRIFDLERKTKSYRDFHTLFEQEKPDFVFSTNQRTVAAIAPVLAAQDLNIPTGTFIFSWDNLPKATLVLEPDFYFVWSQHMKNELLAYYPFITKDQIFVTGTPQFEKHQESRWITPKDDFFKQHQLDIQKKYICYSGDDVTTSPNDPQYLADLCSAIRRLNTQGQNLGVVFRRCPVDFSDRFNHVLTENQDIIVSIDPVWERAGEGWNTYLPTVADMHLQLSTIAHTEMVVNLGSTMVFDYVSFQKPCAFVNYDVVDCPREHWSVTKIYKYVHFRSMPQPESVLWINSPNDLDQIILQGMSNSSATVQAAQKWFEIINQDQPNKASLRILEAIKIIISKELAQQHIN